MRSKKLEPGLSASPAGMAAAVAVVGVVRAEEGGAAAGGADLETEVSVGVEVVEARAAVRGGDGRRGWW
jgi:hypothetical protein